MKEYQFRMEEAAKRDHRRIGITQDLFRFNELSPGSAFFSPMGTRLYNTLIEFMRKQYRIRGYTEVTTPNIFNMQLWNISGHAQNYKQNMFVFEVEKQEYAFPFPQCFIVTFYALPFPH
jgi:threonyl-tRNA synthetase